MMIFRSTDLFRETYIFSRAGFRMFPADKKGIVLFPPKKKEVLLELLYGKMSFTLILACRQH